jgi:hypothetical protein
LAGTTVSFAALIVFMASIAEAVVPAETARSTSDPRMTGSSATGVTMETPQ